MHEWLDYVSIALNGRMLDYLIIQHMESDHSSNIMAFLQKYANATVVTTAKAFQMMKQFYECDYEERRIIVEDFDKLNLESHVLNFIMAPMVH